METLFRRTDRETRAWSVQAAARHVASRGLMRAGAPIARRPPVSQAGILRERPAIRRRSVTRHDRAGTGVGSRRARLAVAAVGARNAVRTSGWTGPLPFPRRAP